ncbi:MAG: hypothetical protein RBR52_04810 [Thiomonas sp.]|uniref:DUF3024 domain-containing protein n=1 Tax=Thiomonas sp. TaxID=2047785 RepID=UPI002A367F95|nr:hypothetical protein [Thiomonas sp.]MDY0329799.1 hypothetical protein [Thiomonas sp.]
MVAAPVDGRAGQGVAEVRDLLAERIRRALARRTRYRYVRPRVEPEGQGWKIVSPNCSRNIDQRGGDIDIAWLAPDGENGWLLFARDHARDCWDLRRRSRRLDELFAALLLDPQREYWR